MHTRTEVAAKSSEQHRRAACGRRAGPAVAGLAAVLLVGPTGAAERESARAFLATTFALTGEDFDRVHQGRVVTRTVRATDAREVATFGIMRVRVTPEFYVHRLADIVNFKKADAVLQIGVFSDPPALRDVADLTLDSSDIRSLRECRVGRCGVQLPAGAIDRFRRDVDWTQADARDQANRLMRQILVEYVSAYQQAGAATSMLYADRAQTVDVRREFLSLTSSDTGGWDRFPALRRHLVEYPGVRAPDVIDRVYWSTERVGRQPVASVTHLAISRHAAESPAAYAVASKQIYGTHYFDASLGLTVLVRDRQAESAATYVAYLNRSRVDVFGGMFGGMTRRIVTSRARGTVGDQLADLQRRLEHEFASEYRH